MLQFDRNNIIITAQEPPCIIGTAKLVLYQPICELCGLQDDDVIRMMNKECEREFHWHYEEVSYFLDSPSGLNAESQKAGLLCLF